MKTFVQYGAGGIGRGFLGELFFDAGYKIIFIDADETLINALNEKKEYTIEIIGNEKTERKTVRGVSCVNGRETETAAETIAGADIMATAVGVNVLPAIAPTIAAGLRRKWKNDQNVYTNLQFFNIIICENLIDADKFLREKIYAFLNERERQVFDKYVGLSCASVGRMVPLLTAQDKKNDPLRVKVEPYRELPVDAGAFKGEFPNVRGLVAASQFEFYIRRKLFMHNMGHAVAAYLGFLTGCEYIWRAMDDENIRRAVDGAMRESALALSKKYNVSVEECINHADDLTRRFGNRSLGDTVARVGADGFRKTHSSARLAGAIIFCREAGVDPVHISAGFAAAFFFGGRGVSKTETDLKTDADCIIDAGTLRLRELIKKDGEEGVLRNHCGLDGKDGDIKRILTFIDILKNGAEISDLMKEIEKR